MATEEQTDSSGAPQTRVIKRYSNRKLYDTKDSRYVTLQQIGEMVRRGEHVQIIDNKTKEDKTEVTLALIISEDLKTKPQSVPLGMLRTLIQKRGERLLTQLRDGPIGRLITGADEETAAAAATDSADGAASATANGSAAEARAAGAGAPPSAERAPEPAAGDGDDRSAAAARGERAGAGDERPTNVAKARIHELVETSRATLDQLQATFDERIQELVPGLGLIRDLRSQVRQLNERLEQLEAKVAELTGESAGTTTKTKGGKQ